MAELSKNDILNYFEEINRRLAQKNKTGEIVIAGGAALTVVFNARDATHDIDAVFAPPQDMREIIKSMAKDYNLHDDWFNDGVKGFVTDKMNFTPILSYSNLSVSNVDARGLLAMKLTSARDNTKDMDDSIFLMKHLEIGSEKELFNIIEKYTHPKQQSMRSRFFTQEAYFRYQRDVSKN